MSNLPAIQAQGEIVTGETRLDEHPAAVYLAGLASSSRRTQKGALDTIAQIVTGDETATAAGLPWHRLRFQHTQAIRSALADRYAHSTANRMLAALRETLKAAWKLGLMTAEEYHKAASVESVKGHSEPAGRAIGSGEIRAMLDTCEQSALGIRDAAMISLLYGCGLRRAELVGLNLADYGREEGEILVRGKGNKERAVPIGGAAPALEDWLEIRGDVAGALFLGLGNRQRGERMTCQAAYAMLKKRAEQADVKNISPHDFRRTYVGDLLDAGADIVTVQKMAGHADPATTSRYDRRGKKARQKAARLLHVPYTKRTLPGQGESVRS